MLYDLALERKLGSLEALDIGEPRDRLLRTHIGMNQESLLSIWTFFPWRFKFLEKQVGWVILPVPLPEGLPRMQGAEEGSSGGCWEVRH